MLFWDVDTQKDFLLPSGLLYVSGAEKIIATLHELTVWAGAQEVPIISSGMRPPARRSRLRDLRRSLHGRNTRSTKGTRDPAFQPVHHTEPEN